MTTQRVVCVVVSGSRAVSGRRLGAAGNRRVRGAGGGGGGGVQRVSRTPPLGPPEINTYGKRACTPPPPVEVSLCFFIILLLSLSLPLSIIIRRHRPVHPLFSI